jgi:adenylate cyclase
VLKNQVRLGGDTLSVTTLFSDIRGFTATSERLDAQSLVALLNESFTERVDTVMAYGGVVDKSIGDAMMVVFGAPVLDMAGGGSSANTHMEFVDHEGRVVQRMKSTC